jgi:serine protein kinase
LPAVSGRLAFTNGFGRVRMKSKIMPKMLRVPKIRMIFGIMDVSEFLFTGSGYMKWMEEVNKEEGRYQNVLAFDDYMKLFEKNPEKELRPTNIYLRDMFDYFGSGTNGSFNLFTREHSDAPPVHGQIKTQKRIYNYLQNFMEEGFNNKFILLIGPNGSSKSSLIKKIMLSAEDYSSTDEGSLFSFSWIFPIDQFIKGSLGLSSSGGEKNINSYAFLEDKDISAIITSELKDHPILILPIHTRQKLIEDAFQDDPTRLETIKKSYLYNGDLSLRNRLIFDALLKNYKGNYQEVFKHVRVERLFINRRYSIGATTIEPQLHVDANLQQITMDRRLASLPPSLQSLNLFSISGEVVLANRGILEFSDLLKRPLDTFKYLLMTMESKTINLHGILTELDIFFIGSSNEIHFAAFKQHPDFNSFKGRFNFLRVPYLLNYRDEEKIYSEQILKLKEETSFEPHSLTTLCLWSVMTRMRAPIAKNFQDEKLGKIAEALSPLEKCLLYSDKETPEAFDSESRQILKMGVEELQNEYENDSMYEGKFGASPREVKQIIYDLAYTNKTVTFVEVLEYLRILNERKAEYDFLNISHQGEYHNPKKFIDLIELWNLDLLDNEVRESLGLVDERSYEDYVSKYILSINAVIKGEKVKNNVTGKFEAPDSYFIREFESNVHMNEAAEKFRSNLIARLGAYALDNPGRPIVYSEVFEDLVHLLQESFRKEQKKIIDKIGRNLVLYLDDQQVEGDVRDMITNIIKSLQEKYHYTQNGAIASLQYLLKMRYETQK